MIQDPAAPVQDFGKTFSPDAIDYGRTSALTFTIDNSASLAPAANLISQRKAPVPDPYH